MKSDFLGVGWSFPMRLDDNGQIEMDAYEDKVRQSIWVILGTAPGERVMRSDFGCGIHNYAFAPNSAATRGQLVAAVRESLLNWEPRIDVLSVNAYSERDRPNTIFIQIDYSVRTTNNRFNLVYPFYLDNP